MRNTGLIIIEIRKQIYTIERSVLGRGGSAKLHRGRINIERDHRVSIFRSGG